jgi:ubiquinone/menaquinone biosynthesis C-methylase UbiE
MLNDPFQTGRSAHRLLFDFAVGLSLLNFDKPNKKILDFACGTGWTSEFLNKVGFDVYSFDIDKDAVKQASSRYKFDKRINIKRSHFKTHDGHYLKYENDFFGHVFCFDSLHHMKDYEQVFKEIYRVLENGGNAVFIEPGANHSKSKETINFLKEHEHHEHREYWLEKDVVLEEIYNLTKRVGFKDFKIKPFLDPSLISFNFVDWYNILDNDEGIRNYMNEFRRFNYDDRVIFSITK